TRPSYYLDFTLSDKIPEIRTSKQNVRFRCRTKAQYSDRVYYSAYSEASDYIEVAPGPPRVNTALISTTKTCIGDNVGTMILPGTGITSYYSTMRWILRPGLTPAPCDPGLGTGVSNCGDEFDWSEGTVPVSGGISISNIPKGDYSLWVLNPGVEAGNCFTSYPVTIGEFDALAATENTAQHVNLSCYNSADGKIGVTATGADPAGTYYFTLLSGTTVVRARQAGTGATMLWQNLPAGTYKVQVENSTCTRIATVDNITLTQPPSISAVATPVQPTCITPGNGSITVTASATGGTVANYTFNLLKGGVSDPQSATVATNTRTFTGLSGGTYTVQVLNADKPSCTGWSSNVPLNVVTPLALQLTSRDSVSCNGGSDGRLQVSATGGSGLYQYTLGTTTNTTGLFTGLAAGTYTVKLKNQSVTCSDEVSASFTIFQRPALSVVLQKTDITCNGAMNGILKAIPNGGSGSYKYGWQQLKNGVWTTNSFWFNTDQQIEGLEPGTYRVIITDDKASGCTVTSQQITITEPAAVQITNVSVREAVCMADGAGITMTGTGGDGNYIYEWSLNGGTTYQPFTSTTKFTVAGNYQLRLKDGKGCEVEAAQLYTITLPAAALDFTTQLSHISCKDAGDGKITVTTNGGNGGPYTGYQYKLNNGAYQASAVFSNLAAGTYTVTVKDGRGCEVTKSVTLTQPNLYLHGTKQDITCYGQSVGSITIAAGGGVAPYQVTLNGTTVNANGTVAGLPAGTYALHIKDAKGCIKDSTIEILHLYPELKIESAVAHDIRCFGESGKIVITVSGGNGVYTYSLNGNSYTNGAALGAGVYHLMVTDGKGCTVAYPDALEITAPPAAMSFTAVLSDYNGYNISCVGGDNGYAQVTAVGGYGGYTYTLDNNAYSNDAMLTHINAGVHAIHVQDAKGCIVSNNYTFTQSSQAINISLVRKQDVSCANIPAGSLTVAGSGGTGSLQYSLDNIYWQSSPSFNNLIAGNYNVLVTDINSCKSSLPVQINSTSPAIIVDSINLHNIICYGGKGSIEVHARGGTGPLTSEYSWNGSSYTAFTNATQLDIGIYTIRVKDASGCYSSVSAAYSITAPAEPLEVVISSKDISCYGLADGSISISTRGGVNPYQYSINNNAYSTVKTYNNLIAGLYTIRVKDSRGCISTQQVTLHQPAAPLALTVSSIEDLVCGANPTGVITLQSTGGTTPYTYTSSDTWQDAPVLGGLTSGDYIVQVKDVNGCTAQQSVTVKTKYSAISAIADIDSVICYGQSNGAIKLNVTGGDGVYTYEWNTPGKSGANLPAGTYAVKVTDGKGCFQSFSYEVGQPAQLTLQTAAPAICDGLREGTIDAQVNGGITPYQYSLNDTEWRADNYYTDLSSGNYRLQVKDANGCMVNKDLTIGTINVMPEVDFLVASRKNAMDTLAITEISVPAPDNVSWTYHPDAQFLGYNEKGTPMIKFTSPGTYWVGMTASFGSCSYSVKKELVISAYDPLAGPGYNMPVHVIDTVMLSPNPNNGQFNFKVKLNRKQQVVAYVYDMNGVIAGKKQYSPTLQIDDSFSVGGTQTGTFILRVITESESRDVRFIISR
ncbi:MAG TPA: T9SS type A sorting domain-containing protein, partial [Chitinophaga sp.]|nr:T9SS type A sorting domain-containing protein [Chitinophaga sp.]